MTFGWINAVNAGFVALLVTISVVGQKKSALPAMRSRSTALNVLEQAGRYACMALMVLPLLPGLEFGFSAVSAMVLWLLLSAALLLCYAVLWTRRKTRATLLALAVVPAVLFFVSGLLLRHWALLVFAVLFGVSHTAITAQCAQNTKDYPREKKE